MPAVASIAAGYEWSSDGKALTIVLRQGVKFQDGEKMDAAAVKFSLERHLTMPGSNRKAEISALKSIEIIDDHTVKLVLDKPFAMAELRAAALGLLKEARAGD